MQLLNPRLCIQNVEGNHWLINFEHQFNPEENIAFTLLIPKSKTQTVESLSQTSIVRAIEVLTILIKGTPD